MVEGIEQLRVKFEAHRFADWEALQKRDVPILRAWTKQDVSASISEGADGRRRNESTSIEERVWNAWFAVRIGDAVRPNTIRDRAAAIRCGNIGRNIGRRVPVS